MQPSLASSWQAVGISSAQPIRNVAHPVAHPLHPFPCILCRVPWDMRLRPAIPPGLDSAPFLRFQSSLAHPHVRLLPPPLPAAGTALPATSPGALQG